MEIDYIVEGGELGDRRSSDPVEPVREFGRSWGLVLFLGIVTLAVGVVITFRPSNSVHVMAIIFGIWLLVLGVVRIIMAIAERGEGGGTRLGMAFGGLLAMLIGLLVLHHSFETVAILGFIIGVFWVVGGLSELFAGFSREAEGPTCGAHHSRADRDCRRHHVLGLPRIVPVDPRSHPRIGPHRLWHRRDRTGLPDPSPDQGLIEH